MSHGSQSYGQSSSTICISTLKREKIKIWLEKAQIAYLAFKCLNAPCSCRSVSILSREVIPHSPVLKVWAKKNRGLRFIMPKQESCHKKQWLTSCWSELIATSWEAILIKDRLRPDVRMFLVDTLAWNLTPSTNGSNSHYQMFLFFFYSGCNIICLKLLKHTALIHWFCPKFTFIDM